ncbi:MAG TPA: hypothetical protein VGO47_00215 [Chlamydiales bacterium]|jgi:hypothetical protein|nr:hypothetical protein [Chlamydiales bacterium]
MVSKTLLHGHNFIMDCSRDVSYLQRHMSNILQALQSAYFLHPTKLKMPYKAKYPTANAIAIKVKESMFFGDPPLPLFPFSGLESELGSSLTLKKDG